MGERGRELLLSFSEVRIGSDARLRICCSRRFLLPSPRNDTKRVAGGGGALPKAMQHYSELKKIGRGNYGTVFLGRDSRNSRYYCLKQIAMETHSEKERLEAEKEVETLRLLDHPGIVRYHEHFVHDDSLWVVMAYCEGGDLAQHIKLRKKEGRHFEEHEVIDWFVQIVMALHYVHSKRILHRDLKTQNIFISKRLVKLGDFGSAPLLARQRALAVAPPLEPRRRPLPASACARSRRPPLPPPPLPPSSSPPLPSPPSPRAPRPPVRSRQGAGGLDGRREHRHWHSLLHVARGACWGVGCGVGPERLSGRFGRGCGWRARGVSIAPR